MRTVGPIVNVNSGTSKWIDNLAINSSRSATIPNTHRYDVIVLNFKYTYSAATAVNWVIELSDDNGTTFFLYPPVVDPSTSPITVTHPSFTKATGAASSNFTSSVLMTGFTQLKVTVTSTGGGAGDLLTLTAVGQAIT